MCLLRWTSFERSAGMSLASLFQRVSLRVLSIRHAILDPYLPAFDDRKQEMPSHRYLFSCYVYQYHLTQMGAIILELVCPLPPPLAYLR